MVSSVLPLRMMSGMGRRRVPRTRSRRVGGRKMKMMIQGSGRVRRTGGARIRGYGLFDTLKNIGSKAFNLARSVPIISTGLNLAGQQKYADVAKSLGFGRKRVRRTGGARRVGGASARPKKRTFSVYGGRRMSVYGGRKRVTRRGGLFGSLMGAIPLAMRALGGRRRVRRTGGARRRTYPSGLLTLRRMMRR